MIVDVIVRHWYEHAHYYVVNDEPVKYVYTRSPLVSGDGFWSRGAGSSMFIGRCGDYFDFLSGTDRSGDAFGGRKFEIELDDGSKFPCNGDVWSCAPPKGFEPATIQVGVATLSQLNDCYVFFSGNISKSALEKWLSENEPSTDYYKYDEKRRWWRDVLPTLRIVRNRRRAALLRKRGTGIRWEPRIDAWTWQPAQNGGSEG